MSLTVSAYPSGQNPNPNAVYDSFNQMAYGSSDDPKMSYDSWNGDWMGFLNYLADNGDKAALDKLMNYLMSENSAQIARQWTENREDSQFQRFAEDARKAGFNPQALLGFGGNAIASSSSGHTYSGSYQSSYDINKEKNQQNWLKIALSSLIPIIGGLIAAAL